MRTLRDENVHVPVILHTCKHVGGLQEGWSNRVLKDEKVHIPVTPVSLSVVYREDVYGPLEDAEG
jgi:hypothetical protein